MPHGVRHAKQNTIFFFEIKKEIPELFIFGISYKDSLSDSKKYLKEEGNPYSFVGIDQDGKIAFDLKSSPSSSD